MANGNSKWHALSDVGPQNCFDIEEALKLARKGIDWRVQQMQPSKCVRTQAKQIMYFGVIYPSLASCVDKVHHSKKTLRTWANDPSIPEVYFVEKV